MKLKLALASLSVVAVSFTACSGGNNNQSEAPKHRTEVPAPMDESPAPAPKKAEAPKPAPKAEKPAPAVAQKSGKELFAKCISCHGAKAEKKALGKSQIIAGWNSAKIVDALKGYKAGTYGGSMKGLMKGQVAPYSDADIKAVADYISGL